jgi:hypothetical protein
LPKPECDEDQYKLGRTIVLGIKLWLSGNAHEEISQMSLVNDTTITVKTPHSEKATQFRGFNPHQLAERLLRELAAEGKA